MNPGFSSKAIYHVIRVSLGLVFIVSGIMKTGDLKGFSEIINAFALIPTGLCLPAAFLICSLEILLGACLVLDLKGSLGAVLILLVCFVSVLGYALFMGYDIDCGCFGPEDPETVAFQGLKVSIIRDLIMISFIFYLYIWRHKNQYRPFLF